MQFRTELKAPNHLPPITFESKILLIGSCFSNVIGQWLQQHCFNVLLNPFGTIYNPVSISNLFTFNYSDLLREHTIQTESGVACLHYPSTNNRSTLIEFENAIKETYRQFDDFVKNSTHIFITLGTSWVYRYLKTNEIVANCQKLPAAYFSKELLSTQKSIESLEKIIYRIPEKTKIILTLSPVRHIKDGIIENQRSKARLIEAIHCSTERFPNKVFYLPVYEWFMDDLRDYRFYNSDLIHPNEQGIQYVTERFKETFFNDETLYILRLIEQYNQLKNHRPINTSTHDSSKHQRKLAEIQMKISKIKPDLFLR